MPMAPFFSAARLVRLRPARLSGTKALSRSEPRASTWSPPPIRVPSILPAASASAWALPDFCAASICLPAASICWPMAASLPRPLLASTVTVLLLPRLALPSMALVPALARKMPPRIMPATRPTSQPITTTTAA